jgi:hypothetical protein
MKKSEVGSQKSEVKKKSEVGMPNTELENTSGFDISQSELNNSEIEHPTSEIETLPTANSKLPTESTMEVHHHPEVEKKGLKEYVLEGLMIFLAVTMGFFAETIRETISENHTAHDYARSMIEDLKKDTAQLDTGINDLNFMSKRLDTLVELTHTKKINELPGGTWYYYGRFGSYWIGFQSANATLGQLKSSGALRFFKNHKVINAIAQYDQSSQELYDFNTQITYKASTIQLRNKLFDAYYFTPVMNLNISQVSINLFKKRNIPLLSNDRNMMVEYANYCQLKSFDSKYMKSLEIKLLGRAKYLLQVLTEQNE